MYLREYIPHYAKSECIDLYTLMRKGDGTMKSAGVGLLKEHKASKKIVTMFEKNCKPEIDQQFKRLMDEVKEND